MLLSKFLNFQILLFNLIINLIILIFWNKIENDLNMNKKDLQVKEINNYINNKLNPLLEKVVDEIILN